MLDLGTILLNAQPEWTPKPKYRRERIGQTKDGVPITRLHWIDTEKNLSYVQKRKQLGEEATAKLGVTCFG